MKYFLAMLALFFFVASSTQRLEAANGGSQFNKPSNMGQEFFLTFIPCYLETGSNNSRVMIYIAASDTGTAIIEIPGKGYTNTVALKANDIVPVELGPAVAQAINKGTNDEIQREQVYPGTAVHVLTNVPSIVYGVTRFPYTSDSFTGLPIESLGSEYVVASFPDMSAMYGGYSLPSETAVVGVYDSTVVHFTLGGNSVTKTSGGMVSGDVSTFVLNRGDVWLVGNSGSSKGGDLTGSHIIADKPVAVFSGNECANIPIDKQWCDFIDEQDRPVESWGMHYLLPRYESRTFGYYERVFSGKPNTTITRNGHYWKVLNGVGGLENAGWCYERASQLGEAVSFSSENPINVVVYNPGQSDDNISTDPFQMNVLPYEQFIDSCIFCTPGTKGGIGFTKNFMGVVFPLDANGEVPVELEFGISDGTTLVWQPLRQVFGATVPARNIYADTMPNGHVYAYKECVLTNDNVYGVRCSAPMMVYCYGGSDYDSYGHPGAGLSVDVSCRTDGQKPGIAFQTINGRVSGTVTDFPVDPLVRSNLSKMMLAKGSSNAKLTHSGVDGKKTSSMQWQVQVVNPTVDARAVVTVCDRAGNDTTFTIFIPANSDKRPSISSTNGNTACVGSTLSLQCEGDFVSYLWSTGETTSSITLSSQNVEQRQVSVKATNKNGESFNSDVFSVSFVALPPKSAITQNHNTLHAVQSAQSYQWFMDGGIIAGATRQDYPFIYDGDYTVLLTNESGCWSRSDAFSAHLADVSDDLQNSGLSLSPNPTQSQSILHYGELKPNSIELFDLSGKLVNSYRESAIPSDHLTLLLNDLTAGSYTLHVHLQGKIYILNLLKN